MTARARTAAVLAVVALLHAAGWSLYLCYRSGLASATASAGAGTLAYTLGLRHGVDADHVAAIDDTTRLVLARGRRPTAVGLSFALGHSSVVLALSVLVALGVAGQDRLGAVSAYGGVVAAVAAVAFLLLVAALDTAVLADRVRLWRRVVRGDLDAREAERRLRGRGLVARAARGRLRAVGTSPWHVFAVGLLLGLGLETASEVALLGLSARAGGHALPLPALLALPLLFAAGMSAVDTLDGLVMVRAYAWGLHRPLRRVYYDIATTAVGVLVAVLVAGAYLAGLVVRAAHVGGPVASYAAVGDHLGALGYAVVALLLAAWAVAALVWRCGRFEHRYAAAGAEAGP